MTPEELKAWLPVLRQYAVALVGLIGCFIQLVTFAITLILTHGTDGKLSLPFLAAFVGLLTVGTIYIPGSKGSP